MASRGWIHLTILFFFLTILPLLASAFPGIFQDGHTDAPFQKPSFGKPMFGNQDEPSSRPSNEDEEPPQPFTYGQGPNDVPNTANSGTNEPANDGQNNSGAQKEPPQYEPPKNDDVSLVPNKKTDLKVGFYDQTCPRVEAIINDVMTKAYRSDSSIAAALVRLFFHDCFVSGCDASILLDRTPSSEPVEKLAGANGMFVRGFEVIDAIKRQVELACPGVVSCADIMAYANRESLVLAGLPTYDVAVGRRDTDTSLAKNVAGNVPLPDQSVTQIIDLFNRKGFTVEEMVILTGAHSIGIAHCANIIGRFWNQTKRKEIEPAYVSVVAFSCGNNPRQIFPFDMMTEYKLDSSYYKQLLKKRGLIESDQLMAQDPRTGNIMKTLADDQERWYHKFIKSITKLSEIGVLTGDQGQIRKQCRAPNARGLF